MVSPAAFAHLTRRLMDTSVTSVLVNFFILLRRQPYVRLGFLAPAINFSS